MRKIYIQPKSKAIELNLKGIIAESDPSLRNSFSDTSRYNLSRGRDDDDEGDEIDW